MIELLSSLNEPHMSFLFYSLLIGVISSVAFGAVGSLVVTNRIASIAGALSHCILGGIGAALYFNTVWQIKWFSPLIGALFSALIAAFFIGFIKFYTTEREDTLIGALWATGMAIGLVFISQTPGYIDPMGYLFGNIILVSEQDFFLVLALDFVIVATLVFFYNKILATCFDEEFARLRGVNTSFFNLLILLLIGLTIVLLINVVGIILIIALLTIPPAIANQFTNRLSKMIILATCFCLIFNVGGIFLSYYLDFPTGPTIIIFASIIYFLVLLNKRLTR